MSEDSNSLSQSNSGSATKTLLQPSKTSNGMRISNWSRSGWDVSSFGPNFSGWNDSTSASSSPPKLNVEMTDRNQSRMLARKFCAEAGSVESRYIWPSLP